MCDFYLTEILYKDMSTVKKLNRQCVYVYQHFPSLFTLNLSAYKDPKP
jgi:hypothetical protein